MKPVTAGGPYQVPPEPSRTPAIALAVAVHAVLLAFLWFGIDWQNNQPVQVEAEVWDMKVQAAAPPPPPPEEAEPQPEPQPAPPPKVVEKQAEQPVAPPPDIKLEREKKRKEQLKKEQEQREEREAEKAREEAKAKELADKKAAEKQQQKLEEKKQAEKQQKLEEKKEAEKQAAAEKKKAEKLAKAKEAAENSKLARLRAEAMKSIAGAAGTVGTAAKATAPRSDSGYQAAIASKVISNTHYTGSTDVPGNPRVEFQIDQLPTGEIISVKKIKSSGLPAFDDALERGIRNSSPLPKKKDGTVEPSFPISVKLKDLE